MPVPTRPVPAALRRWHRVHPRGAAAFIAALLLGVLLAGSEAIARDDEGEGLIDRELVAEALEVIDERFVDEDALTTENLTEGAIRGIVEALGDEGHTTYLTPEELKVEQDALDGRVLGIGVVLDARAGDPQVIGVVDGSPADEAGLQAGDVIVSVDGHETDRLSLKDLAALVRGDVGTPVRLGIERPGSPALLVLDIVRANVEVEPASWAFVPGTDLAVVRIVQFSAGAGAATRRVVEEALEAEASGILLDLRGNPGGLVDEARAVAGLFLEEGVFYQERDRHGKLKEVTVRGEGAIAPDMPVAVLVDYGTASSAEILAAALRDHGRARLLGARTYGTGTVLNTFHLSDGSAMRIAVRDWLTPEGEDVRDVGVSPDEELELSPGAAALEPDDLIAMTADELALSADAQLRDAVESLELLVGSSEAGEAAS